MRTNCCTWIMELGHKIAIFAMILTTICLHADQAYHIPFDDSGAYSLANKGSVSGVATTVSYNGDVPGAAFGKLPGTESTMYGLVVSGTSGSPYYGSLALPDSSDQFCLNTAGEVMTISAWVNWSGEVSPSTRGGIINKLASTQNIGWSFFIGSDGKLNFNYNGVTASGTRRSTGSVPVDTWAHVALTWNTSSNNALELYINGEQENLSLNYTGSGILKSSSDNIRVGVVARDVDPLRGKIDDISLWNVKLTPVQIRSIYTATTLLQGYDAGVMEQLFKVYDGTNSSYTCNGIEWSYTSGFSTGSNSPGDTWVDSGSYYIWLYDNAGVAEGLIGTVIQDQTEQTDLVYHMPFDTPDSADLSNYGTKGGVAEVHEEYDNVPYADTEVPANIGGGYSEAFPGVGGTSNFGGSLILPDSTSAFSLDNAADSMTISTWIKTSGSEKRGIVNNLPAAQNTGWSFYVLEDNTIAFKYTGPDSNGWRASLTTGDTVPADEWTQVAVTWFCDSLWALKLYVNGIEQDLSLSYTGSGVLTANTDDIRLGVLGRMNNPLRGNMDDFAMWNKSLVKGKIRSLVTAPTVLSGYDAGVMQKIFAVYDGTESACKFNDIVWTKTTGFSTLNGSTQQEVGDTWQAANGDYYIWFDGDSSNPSGVVGKANTKYVFAHFMVCYTPISGSTLDDYKNEILLAQSYGIDGFALNCGAWIYSNGATYKSRTELMYQAAEELGTGFKLFMSMDFASNLCLDDIDDIVATVWNKPNQLYHNNKMVLSSYGGQHHADPESQDYPSGKVWASYVVDHIKSTYPDAQSYNGEIFYIPYYWTENFNPNPTESELNGIVETHTGLDGFFWFGAANFPSSIAEKTAKMVSFWHTGAFPGSTPPANWTSKAYMAPVCPYYRGVNGNFRCFESRGFQGMQQQWISAIDNGADWIEVVTWNDWGESYVAPHAGSGDPLVAMDPNKGIATPHGAFLEASTHYINWFKTGVEPLINEDKLFYFYRLFSRELKGIAYPNDPTTRQYIAPYAWVNGGADNTRPLYLEDGYSENPDYLSDKIYITVFLQEPADVIITVNGVSTTFNGVGKGIHNLFVDMAPGQPRFQVVRNGVTIIDKTGEQAIVDPDSADPDVSSNYNYFTGSASTQ